MVKCALCQQKVPTTFLGKYIGTVVYGSDHKQHVVCADCQRQYKGQSLREKMES